jgi:outer membrane protein OmpA-like peptidoglycan-associated protein/tetratricopeptide (TPR) repeat protein
MKNLYIVCFVLIASTLTLKAQNKSTQKADKLFRQLEYVQATKEYLKLTEKDNYIFKQLAESYYNMFDPAEAIKWYAKTILQPQDAETYYKYSQMLKANGQYQEANDQMATFSSKAPEDQRAIEFRENPNYLPQLLKNRNTFNIEEIAINSDKSEFGAFLSVDNNLYFASARNKSNKIDGIKEEPYLDIFKAAYNQDGTLSTPKEVAELNTKWHDGPVSITADGNTMYFARESFSIKNFEKDKKNNLKFGQVNLFKATQSDGVWTNIVGLPFNSKNYSTSCPSISSDGKTLYFSSNMPGGKGDNDIWKISVNADGSYGKPENLGNSINTAASEQFPFITDNNVLYFASNGKQGLGGLDVFSIDLNSKNPSKAINVGKPVNSEKDDFSFTFNTSKNVGFFASNRSGNDDIYVVHPVCSVEAKIIVTNDKNGQRLESATVTLLDEKKNVLDTKITLANGETETALDCNQFYTIQVVKEGYEGGIFEMPSNKGGKTVVNAPLKPIETIITPTAITLKEINFEFDKSNITKEAAFELDKLVQVMKSNPSLIIAVKSHTDQLGDANYNMILSDRRAKSTVQYVITKGIDAKRITGKGYGETEPKNDCLANCTDEQNAQNRRSEFLIVK